MDEFLLFSWFVYFLAYTPGLSKDWWHKHVLTWKSFPSIPGLLLYIYALLLPTDDYHVCLFERLTASLVMVHLLGGNGLEISEKWSIFQNMEDGCEAECFEQIIVICIVSPQWPYGWTSSGWRVFTDGTSPLGLVDRLIPGAFLLHMISNTKVNKMGAEFESTFRAGMWHGLESEVRCWRALEMKKFVNKQRDGNERIAITNSRNKMKHQCPFPHKWDYDPLIEGNMSM